MYIVEGMSFDMRFGFVISVLLMAALSGCVSYSHFQMEVLRPAALTVPPHIKSVMVVDNSFPILDSVAVDITTNVSYVSYIPEVVDTASSITIKQLVKELNNRQFFDTVHCISQVFNGKNGYRHKPISISQLHTKADSLGVDGVVVLNDYTYKPSLVFSRISENNLFECDQSLSYVINWVFIDLTEKRVIDQFVQIDTLSWKGVMGGYNYPVIGIPTLSEAIAEMAGYMGFYHADHLAPYWENVSRHYYTFGAGFFPEAEMHLKRNQWAEAEKVWYYIYKNSKGIRKAHLAHNIALAKESQSQFEDAARWAHHGLELLQDRSSSQSVRVTAEKNYYLELIKRIDESKKLKLQYGDHVQ